MISLEVDGLELACPGEAEGWLPGQGRRALEEIARRFSLSGEVRVRLVGDAEMADLHACTLNIPETTDVLTFNLLDDEPPGTPGAPGAPGAPGVRGGRIDADLVVCADEAARQATARGHTAERELLLYIVHGVLHCVDGFDDVTDDGAAAMHEAEDEILAAIGVGAVYGG